MVCFKLTTHLATNACGPDLFPFLNLSPFSLICVFWCHFVFYQICSNGANSKDRVGQGREDWLGEPCFKSFSSPPHSLIVEEYKAVHLLLLYQLFTHTLVKILSKNRNIYTLTHTYQYKHVCRFVTSVFHRLPIVTKEMKFDCRIEVLFLKTMRLAPCNGLLAKLTPKMWLGLVE